jgi:hypothetical protein
MGRAAYNDVDLAPLLPIIYKAKVGASASLREPTTPARLEDAQKNPPPEAILIPA